MCKRLFSLLFSAIILLMASPIRDHAGANPARPVPQAPATFELQPVVVASLSAPLYVTGAHDGTNRLFIVESAGVIKVLQPGSSSPTTFLNISSKVKCEAHGDGLLGLVFHPQFSINRRFFVFYTRQPDHAIVVGEYLASATNPNTADVAEKVLLSIQRPSPGSALHNGGMMEFGHDKFLYISTGDGRARGRAQNINEYWGKILRIDVDHPNGSVPYSSPSGNPFFGSAPGLDEIYAYGFRSPHRFSIDRATDQLYVGDVGESAREEIDIVTSGGNYGWSVMEGSICNPTINGGACTPPEGSILPIAEYEHSPNEQNERRCSITGGYVYRGARSALPVGTYIFGDYCTGEILMLGGSNQVQLLLNTQQNIASFGEDDAGEIYVVDLGGAVHRITSSPPPSDCSFSLSPTSQSFPNDGGTGSISVTAGADCNWIAAPTASWINITSDSTGTGNRFVSFSVEANTDPVNPRSGKINIGGQQFVIDQAPTTDRTITSLKLSTTILPGCQSLTGTVTINGPAPSGGLNVSLSDNIAATTMPSMITVQAGATTKSFAITTAPVNATQAGVVRARIGPSVRSATLRVRPMTVLSLDLSPNPVVGPKASTGTIILECRSPTGGLNVSLSSSKPSVASPTVNSINVPAGYINRRFTIQTVDVPAARSATIKATANGVGKSKVLTVN